MLKNYLLIIVAFFLVFPISGQELVSLKNKKEAWEATINKSNGTLESLIFKDGTTVEFRNDSLKGPCWQNAEMTLVDQNNFLFKGKNGSIVYSLQYKSINDKLALVLGMKNTGVELYAPKQERFFMGINTEMVKYPEWNDIFFPTLLRCEKTHFWGYLMSPNGKILTLGSPDPIASYNLHYELGDRGWGKHRIYSFSLDMLHKQPLPTRHPHETSLNPGEEKKWTLFLQQVSSLDDVKPTLSSSLKVPMIDADRYSIQKGESTTVSIYGKAPFVAELISPDGTQSVKKVETINKNNSRLKLELPGVPGRYKLDITDRSGHTAEASFSQIMPYSWYMANARTEAIRNGQHASSHLEQWLGLSSGVHASQYIPNPEEDMIMEAQLMKILALQWDLEKKVPLNIPHASRYMSNTAQMAGLLAEKYLINKDSKWLEIASGFADYVLTCQTSEGYYKPHPNQNTIYTSVFYPAKSLMIVMSAEKVASEKDSKWDDAYNRHYNSVKKAMDHLVRVGDNIETEGQITYEDGMISCSANQLGLFALLQDDAALREKYKNAALHFLKGHQCLQQLLIPDSRMNGATLRFWESQYDILARASMNMMTSPHGWSGWLIPALWYQYLLTGEEVWLTKTMNSMGSCVQVLDSKTGKLNWGFVVDPYLEATVLEKDSATPGRGRRVARTIGEQYLPMISSFHYPEREPVSGNSELVGWTCDNDVHEIFIAMEEIVLSTAYIYQRESGDIRSWNCDAYWDKTTGNLCVTPHESIVNKVHVNLKRSAKIDVLFQTIPNYQEDCQPGMHWIGPGGKYSLLK